MDSDMRRYFLALLLTILSLPGASWATAIAGAGSSAAFPVYRTWAAEYQRAGGDMVNYDPIGSSGGIKKIKAREADFGGSDVAPPPEDLANSQLVILPTVITGAVPVYHLPEFQGGPIVLNGEVLAKIFLGEIARWDDKEIRSLNPNLRLPALAIIPVVRSDGSGTTYNFSDYLAKVSPTWRAQMGVSTKFQWADSFVAAKGSSGVVDKVVSTSGSIGYVDYNYVVEHHLNSISMVNARGQITAPSPESFRAALKASVWQSKGDFTQTLTNQDGKGSWPITMGTFVLLPKVARQPEQTRQAIRFFTWAFIHGDQLTDRINFVRLPDLVQAKAYRALAEIVGPDGRHIGFEALRTLVPKENQL
jgi:phosphate transport system substrate-binding protein